MNRTFLTDRPVFRAASVLATATFTSPAFAFEAAGTKITSAACEGYHAGQKILLAAAVLAILIGLAPMLWGQVKAKWLISSFVFVIAIGLVHKIIGAFAGTTAC